MHMSVLVSNLNDLEGTLFVVRNDGPVPVQEERGRRQTRLEALPVSYLYLPRCDVDVEGYPCHLKGCSQHFEISATILNGKVASGRTLSHVLLLLQPS
jgi:hypothetical protein